MTQRSMARKQEYRKEIESQLADITREAQSDAEKFVSVSADLDRMEIKSPSTGQVVGLTVQTVGAVLQPGQQILDVVPDNQTLLLEAHIPPQVNDKVQAGLLTYIRFNTFAHSLKLVVEGKVLTGSGYFLVVRQTREFAFYFATVKGICVVLKNCGSSHNTT